MNTISRTAFCTTWTDEFGITHIVYEKETDIDLEKARELIALFSGKKEGRKIFLVKDLRNIRMISSDALSYLSSHAISRHIAAEAFIIDSLASRLLVNFFMKKYKNSHLVCEKFNCQYNAYSWVLSQKQQIEN
jgi:hypothetical protein